MNTDTTASDHPADDDSNKPRDGHIQSENQKTQTGLADHTMDFHSKHQNNDQQRNAQASNTEPLPGEKTIAQPDVTIASTGSKSHSSLSVSNPPSTRAELPTMAPRTGTDERADSQDFQTERTLQTRRENTTAGATINSAEQQSIFGKSQYFKKIHSHAKGGLGEVFLAHDTSLDRQVALKEMQPRAARHQESRDRFEFEARITGNLEHPQIVPVYATGCHEDGRPFYAMRFVRGNTLQESIQEFHKSYRGKTLSKQRWYSPEFRAILTRLIATCNGIAFAHSKGVIHRDIKPANIMLGRYGETLIVDWGLAKYVGQDEVTMSLADAGLSAVSGNTPSMTIEGSALGTPGYMSPEQASGSLAELSSPTDIFSLGATLYAALIGKPPFEGLSPQTVIDKVKQADFEHPRLRDRTIPKPLEAICLKAMSILAIDRYESALDMANDLEQFLAGEPVSCYREPIVTRTARYLRKHQTFAVSGTLLLLTAAIGSSLAAMMIGAEEQKTKTALAQIVLEQTRTKAALEAESAARTETGGWVSLLTNNLVGQMMARKDRLASEDEELLKAVLKRFESSTQIEGDSNEAIEIRAEGFRRVGSLQRQLGQLKPAQSSFESAEKLFAELANRNPNSLATQIAYASAVSGAGVTAADLGDDTTALMHYNKSVEVLQKLNSAQLNEATQNIARDTNNNDANEEIDLPLQLSEILGNRANVNTRLGKIKAAEADYLESLRQLGADSVANKTVSHRMELARQRLGFAGLLTRDPKRTAEAAAVYRQAVEGYRELNAELNSPTNVVYQFSVALANQGSIHSTLRDQKNALDCFNEATTLAQSLVDQFPGFFRYQLLLGRNRMLLGKQLALTNSPKAKAELATSQKILTALQLDQPDNQQLQRETAELLTTLANVETDDDLAAEKFYAEALELRKELQQIDPKNDVWAEDRIATQINFTNFLRRKGQYKKAAVQLTELLKFLDGQEPLDPRLIQQTLIGMADCYGQFKQFDQALTCWERLASNQRSSNFPRFELQRAICLVRTGALADGLAVADNTADQFGKKTVVLLYDAACCYAIASSSDSLPDELTPAALQEKALNYLTNAGEKGFFADADMRSHAATDSDLNALRELDAFKVICKKYEIKKDSKPEF